MPLQELQWHRCCCRHQNQAPCLTQAPCSNVVAAIACLKPPVVEIDKGACSYGPTKTHERSTMAIEWQLNCHNKRIVMREWSRVLLEVMQICFHVKPKFAKICDSTVITFSMILPKNNKVRTSFSLKLC
jgi:hypothetical protein